MAIHDTPFIAIHNIPIKNEVKYLGINISKDLDHRTTSNIESILKKNRTILNTWFQRDLSIFGGILLSKMEGLSRLIYPAYSLAVPDGMIKTINQIILVLFGRINIITFE